MYDINFITELAVEDFKLNVELEERLNVLVRSSDFEIVRVSETGLILFSTKRSDATSSYYCFTLAIYKEYYNELVHITHFLDKDKALKAFEILF